MYSRGYRKNYQEGYMQENRSVSASVRVVRGVSYVHGIAVSPSRVPQGSTDLCARLAVCPAWIRNEPAISWVTATP